MAAFREYWPGWETVRKIGSGGFSTVYEIRKTDESGIFNAALKVISVPQSQDEYQSYMDEGYDENSVTTIFQNRISQMVAEFQTMAEFKGTSNIVSYEDHMIVPHADGKGWDILIRMELLTSLAAYYNEKGGMEEEEVRELGKDVCRALMLCAKKNIVHRDIKPQNIFINDFGDFKLGDFGIAKTMERSTRATKAGTLGYMAPEVYFGRPYGDKADQYSLGLVLYWLMNGRRMPFLPLPPEIPTAEENENAQNMRLDGEKLPPPAYASEAFAKVILKACAPDPSDRYADAAEFRAAIKDLPSLRGQSAPTEELPGEVPETVKAGESQEHRCTSCGAELNARAARCPRCGEFTGITISAFDEICPHCGCVTPRGKAYCAVCGRPLKPEPEPEPPKPEPPIPEPRVCQKCGRLLPDGAVECDFCKVQRPRKLNSQQTDAYDQLGTQQSYTPPQPDNRQMGAQQTYNPQPTYYQAPLQTTQQTIEQNSEKKKKTRWPAGYILLMAFLVLEWIGGTIGSWYGGGAIAGIGYFIIFGAVNVLVYRRWKKKFSNKQ